MKFLFCLGLFWYLLSAIGQEYKGEKPVKIFRPNYFYYQPAGANANRPLIVYLHGCVQPLEHARLASRLEEYADHFGYSLLMPIQNNAKNPAHCWNWYLKSNASRGKGELGDIVDLTKKIQNKYHLSKEKTFVMGYSAGGALASHAIACYSEIFQKAFIYAGAAFRMLPEPTEFDSDLLKGASPLSPIELSNRARDCALTTPHPRPVSVLVLHGDSDPISNPLNGLQIAQQFFGMNQLLIGKELLPETSFLPEMVEYFPETETKYAYRHSYFSKIRNQSIELIQVEHLGHAWSGGPGEIPFSNPMGPDGSALAIEFFGIK